MRWLSFRRRSAPQLVEAVDLVEPDRSGPRVFDAAVGEDAFSFADHAPLSRQIVIEYLPHATRRDAYDWGRASARELCAHPEASAVYVEPYGEGFCVEIQEGAHGPYLPDVLARIRARPDVAVAVPMQKRFLVVSTLRGPSDLFVEVRPEHEQRPPVGSVVGLRATGTMLPVVAQYREWLLAGVATFVVGAAALLVSLLWYAFDPAARPPPAWRTTETSKLPIAQAATAARGSGSDYLARMTYVGGAWRFERRTDPALSEIGGGDEPPGVSGANGQASSVPSLGAR